MRKVPIFVMAMVLSTAGALPVNVTARADLVPGGWLQPPRIPQAPPEPEAVPPADEPAAVQPLPSPKVTRPAVQHRPPPVRTAPPSDGKVQF